MIYTDGIHLVADSLDELHNFCQEQGIKRAWFEKRKTHPHYDIPKKFNGKLIQLLLSGAVQAVPGRKVVELSKKQLENDSHEIQPGS